MTPSEAREDFVAVPARMTVALLSAVASAIVLGLLLVTDGSAAGWLLVAAAGGPLLVLVHAHRTALENRRRKSA